MKVLQGTYRITPQMLNAGAAVMEQCHNLGGHTPHTACQAIFTAMLNAADIHPGASLRASFSQSRHETAFTASRPPLSLPLDSYRGFEPLDNWKWRGWDHKHRLHYFEHADTGKWIRAQDNAWKDRRFVARIDGYRVDTWLVHHHVKLKTLTLS